MWYLILPPIIVVIALVLIIYFFSRRLPAVTERLKNGGTRTGERVAQPSHFGEKIRHFFFHRLEKLAQRFKVFFLKSHNIFNRFIAFIRFRKQRLEQNMSREARPEPSAPKIPAQPVSAKVSRKYFPTFRKPATVSDVNVKAAPAPVTVPQVPGRGFRQRFQMIRESLAPAEENKQPVISRHITRPERIKMMAPSVPKSEFETLLIERIAGNPRDIEAYERLGDYYMEHGSYMDAKECYKQVLKLSPVNRLVKIKVRRLEKILERR